MGEETIQRNIIILLIKYWNENEGTNYDDVGAVQVYKKKSGESEIR